VRAPKCKYNGKVVDCLTYTSESGGITGEILVEILTYFNSIDLFPRVPGGPVPVLIVDGHQSRLVPVFLEYINDKNHTWKVCLGVPYATTLWQVGDASEQNGMVKLEWYREKRELLTWKYLNNLPRAIRPEDVMPLMNKIVRPTKVGNAVMAGMIRLIPNSTSILDWETAKTTRLLKVT
jgi:hypothetical protein